MNDRKVLTGRIAARDEAVNAEREQEGIVLANLGQSVFDCGLPELKSLDEFVKTVVTVTDEIRELEDSLRQMLADGEKRSVILEEQKSLKVELRNMKNKEEHLFDELGKCAWDLWKSGRLIDDKMEKALDVLVKAEFRLNTAEDAMHRNENDEGGKASVLFAKGKAFLLAGRRNTASTALDRLLGRAGRNIYEMIPSEAFTDTPAAVSSSTLKALGDRRNEIAEREKDLAGEITALDAAIEDMPGKGGVKRREGWIEDALETRQIKLDDAFQNLGKAWLGNSRGKSTDIQVEKCRKEWSAINSRISIIEDEQRALTAYRDVLESELLRDQKAVQVSKLAAELKNQQTVLKDLKKDLALLEKNLTARKESLPPLPEDE